VEPEDERIHSARKIIGKVQAIWTVEEPKMFIRFSNATPFRLIEPQVQKRLD